MKFVTPHVFFLADSQLPGVSDMDDTNCTEVMEYLDAIGAPNWGTDATTGGEELIEIAGRSCYKSFETAEVSASDLNPNLTGVRKGNKKYLRHILEVNHGSVLEHATVTYALHHVSRVFTHELVRHRVGTAYSQESLRYVRLTEIPIWFPKVFDDIQDQEKKRKLIEMFVDYIRYTEKTQHQMASLLGLYDEDGPKNFAQKKKLTSAMRRLAPMGLATGIVVTANHRAWRHMIQMRTHNSAEEEMRLVFNLIYQDLRKRYSNIYQDALCYDVDGFGEVVFGDREYD